MWRVLGEEKNEQCDWCRHCRRSYICTRSHKRPAHFRHRNRIQEFPRQKKRRRKTQKAKIEQTKILPTGWFICDIIHSNMRAYREHAWRRQRKLYGEKCVGVCVCVCSLVVRDNLVKLFFFPSSSPCFAFSRTQSLTHTHTHTHC